MKTRLPDQPVRLFDSNASTICEHLSPVLAYLHTRGVSSESRHQLESGWLVILVDGFFYKQEIDTHFERPSFLEWSYADPHYGEGNSLLCTVCRNALQARFDSSNPGRTLGIGR